DTRALYAAGRYQPRWPSVDAQASLYRALEAASADGLPPALVHADPLDRVARRLIDLGGDRPDEDAPDPRAALLAEADLLLTDALLAYAEALLGRRVAPDSLYPEQWHAAPRPDSAVFPLYRAIHAGDAPAAL